MRTIRVEENRRPLGYSTWPNGELRDPRWGGGGGGGWGGGGGEFYDTSLKPNKSAVDREGENTLYQNKQRTPRFGHNGKGKSHSPPSGCVGEEKKRTRGCKAPIVGTKTDPNGDIMKNNGEGPSPWYLTSTTFLSVGRRGKKGPCTKKRRELTREDYYKHRRGKERGAVFFGRTWRGNMS